MGRLVRAIVLLVVVVILIQVAPRVKATSWSDLGTSLQNEAMRVLGAAIKSGEPVAEPIASIQNQSDQLLEAIKKLPEDQLRAVKKQLYQEFCENLLKEPGN